MRLQVEVEALISNPINEVFEAVVYPEKMSNYFISSGSNRLTEGETIIWKWDDVGAELPIKVKQVDVEHYFISFLWSASGVETNVELKLESLDEGKTKVNVREVGWGCDEDGIKRYGQQTQGWVDMLNCMKAYLEFGINLRKGMKPITNHDYLTKTKTKTFELKVERLMACKPDILYRAWTKEFDKWFAAPGTVLMQGETDTVFYFETIYKLENQDIAQRHPHYGRFLRLELDRLIEMTWVTGAEGTKGAETVLTVEIEPHYNGSNLSLKHTGFPDEESKNQHEHAWPFVLELLDKKMLVN